ncbi:hypothetical protein U9M48_034451 [Paspalum notatum var. saurae]|uniref:Integrase zinc-binding domain-containing protein n=1 Tax=Paspalum notatum var. saurae TaxID=547442 RepID=A0AAQ3X724_PASNO
MEEGLLPDFGRIAWGRLCVPPNKDIRDSIPTKAHCTKYSIHPGSTKMYQDLEKAVRWRRMKRDIAEFVADVMSATSKGEKRETRRFAETSRDSNVEMGEDYHGLHSRASPLSKGKRLHMGNC